MVSPDSGKGAKPFSLQFSLLRQASFPSGKNHHQRYGAEQGQAEIEDKFRAIIDRFRKMANQGTHDFTFQRRNYCPSNGRISPLRWYKILPICKGGSLSSGEGWVMVGLTGLVAGAGRGVVVGMAG